MTEANAPDLMEGVTLVKQLDVAALMDFESDKANYAKDENEIFEKSVELSEHRDAALLLAVAAIATKEIHIDGLVWDDDEPFMGRSMSFAAIPSVHVSDGGRTTSPPLTPWSLEHGSDMEDLTLPPTADRLAWSLIRSVSIDSPEDENTRSSRELHRKGTLNIISPESSPVSSRMPIRKPGLRVFTKHRSYSTDSSDSSSEKRPLQTQNKAKNHGMKTILRKKFSWKNYPEVSVRLVVSILSSLFGGQLLTLSFDCMLLLLIQLEAFLIANREEYLRHSALNYTIQQKQYNNRLTERLLELAAEHGYVFDEEAFSFAMVRDRIRCYFKSYVQSAKKRGVIIGYAARKAGLLTEEDLEKSAGITGRIVLPSVRK